MGIRIGARWLLHKLDLRVPAGSCAALLGDNGTGKTTLLRACHGEQELTEGALTVDGRVPDERDPAFRAVVSVLFDDSALFDALTPRQHLDALGLDLDPELPDTPAYTLSSGQRRKLLLLGALRREHRVLLLDEPERALDATARRWLADEVVAAKGRGAAVVLTTHDQRLVERVADVVVDLG
ncbi:ABC transporter ATP-binding protein [Actinokineospora bangkokensis]|uniref:ABC transporter domain-containing protein n=1 Tax=Actinokineospora bangkokensis TaxID=1193682 RepID=A0A1Q9LFY1_9PSEU|nr:ATP-binding cassette domain-containing protein [Actinokineospora bangkokensis]OLR90933.1 hypothetical protein BJP25_30735 [Actinokineospora bangkokensis]